jgi:hypothetical protein
MVKHVKYKLSGDVHSPDVADELLETQAEPLTETSTAQTTPVQVLYAPVVPEPFWKRASVPKPLIWLGAAAALLMLRKVAR